MQIHFYPVGRSDIPPLDHSQAELSRGDKRQVLWGQVARLRAYPVGRSDEFTSLRTTTSQLAGVA